MRSSEGRRFEEGKGKISSGSEAVGAGGVGDRRRTRSPGGLRAIQWQRKMVKMSGKSWGIIEKDIGKYESDDDGSSASKLSRKNPSKPRRS